MKEKSRRKLCVPKPSAMCCLVLVLLSCSGLLVSCNGSASAALMQSLQLNIQKVAAEATKCHPTKSPCAIGQEIGKSVAQVAAEYVAMRGKAEDVGKSMVDDWLNSSDNNPYIDRKCMVDFYQKSYPLYFKHYTKKYELTCKQGSPNSSVFVPHFASAKQENEIKTAEKKLEYLLSELTKATEVQSVVIANQIQNALKVVNAANAKVCTISKHDLQDQIHASKADMKLYKKQMTVALKKGKHEEAIKAANLRDVAYENLHQEAHLLQLLLKTKYCKHSSKIYEEKVHLRTLQIRLQKQVSPAKRTTLLKEVKQTQKILTTLKNQKQIKKAQHTLRSNSKALKKIEKKLLKGAVISKTELKVVKQKVEKLRRVQKVLTSKKEKKEVEILIRKYQQIANKTDKKKVTKRSAGNKEIKRTTVRKLKEKTVRLHTEITKLQAKIKTATPAQKKVLEKKLHKAEAKLHKTQKKIVSVKKHGVVHHKKSTKKIVKKLEKKTVRLEKKITKLQAKIKTATPAQKKVLEKKLHKAEAKLHKTQSLLISQKSSSTCPCCTQTASTYLQRIDQLKFLIAQFSSRKHDVSTVAKSESLLASIV